MLAPREMFAYVVIAPGPCGDGTVECDATLAAPIEPRGEPVFDQRLVGYHPRVQFTEAGLTPDPNSQRPHVLRCQITLIADSKKLARVAEVSFHVDKAMMSAANAGDEIYLTRTACAGLGLSIIREGRLIAAAGAITEVPLGNVSVTIPMPLISRAEAVFREWDPKFLWMAEYPLAVEVDGHRAILSKGSRKFGSYRVSVEHGFIRGIPGTDECASVYDADMCPDVAAAASALLLKNGGFHRGAW